jgi:hypothetical protein
MAITQTTPPPKSARNTGTSHDVAWAAPQPFWTDNTQAVQPGNALRRPQILRFTHDAFIPELLSTLQQNPAALPGFAAMAETWRGPGAAPAKDPQQWLQGKPARLFGLQRRVLMRKQQLQAQQVQQTQQAQNMVPTPAPVKPTLKLYQPAHMRHYLVGGSLVCRVPGLPDRQIDPARHQVSFVVRRLLPRAPGKKDDALPDPTQAALWDEYGYVPNGKAGVWQFVGAADSEAGAATLLPSEERLSLFPAHFTQDDGHPRRLYVGSVPVGHREAYQGATAQGTADGKTTTNTTSDTLDPRLVLFYTQVLGPWKALVNSVMGNGLPGADPDDANALKTARPTKVFFQPDDKLDPTTADPDTGILRTMRGALQTSSWYLLLDLYTFLKEQLGIDVAAGAPSDPAARALYNALDAAAMPDDLAADNKGPLLETNGSFDVDHIETKLIDAMVRIVPLAAALEQATGSFSIPAPGVAVLDDGFTGGWPDFLFLFADPWLGVLQPPTPADFNPPANDYLVEKIQARIDSLADLVRAALPAVDPAKPLPEPTLAAMQPADMREAWYVMRLVYERPDCAPFHGNVVSAATQPFNMAGFFDSDAPARPIRIGLPVDISPAGLRKFDKNAVFMMSDMLCGQVDRMKGIGLVDLVLSVLPWPFHKPLSVPEKGDCKNGDGLSLGVMCSLSIPIITICALLLLMIIVSLLDFIFRWLPYFIVCFPIPGFKGRKAP